MLSWLALLAWLGPGAIPAAGAACANEANRLGPSAYLPDCRAYELVTPPNTNGRLVGPVNTFSQPPNFRLLPVEHLSPGSGSVVYMTYNSPLLDPSGAIGEIDVYEAEREQGGWSTVRHLGPSGPQALQAIPGGFSPDHRYGFTAVLGDLSELSLEGPTDYLVKSDGSLELTGIGSIGSDPFAEGRWISEGGEHVIFTTGDSPGQGSWCLLLGPKCEVVQLEPDAPPTGTSAVYDRSADGPTRVVSLLPGDVTPAAGEDAFYKGASKDASAVAFEIEGTLYVRVDSEETLEVAAGGPTYAGLSDDGRYLFYVAGGNIHRFDIETAEDDQVNSTDDGEVVNVSTDGSHVYFISKSQIGGEGTAGEPNMYMWSGGPSEYIATVLASDLERTSGTVSGMPALANWTRHVTNQTTGHLPGPGAEASRVTPDGRVLVFESRAQLTGYDNDGHTEIYRYDEADKSLLCVSCNPLGEPATMDAHLQELVYTGAPTVIHNVTDDGSRIFFETEEALVEEDTGGVNDIYEWQEEEGGASVDLISSGQSVEYPLFPGIEAVQVPSPNVLLSVAPDGEDVVFVSQDALVPGAGEGGAQAIYDARINGGFPPPAVLPKCAEEGCRSVPASPSALLGQAQSEETQGAGNVKLRKRKPHCRRARHKKHKHCTKKKTRNRARARAASVDAPGSSVTITSSPPASVPDSARSSLERGELARDASVSVGALADPFDEFGIEKVSAGLSASAAGMHPDFTTEITLNHFINEKTGKVGANARTEEVSVALPPGLLANVNAIPKCKTGELLAWGNCPIDSQVGIAKVLTVLLGNQVTEPIYNLEPPHPEEEIARFGFSVAGLPVFIDVRVRTASDYGAEATVHSAPALTALLGAKTTLWGNPADPSHDKQRLTPQEAPLCPGTACKAPEGKRSSGLPPTAFLVNPSACQGMEVGFAAKSYQLPGQVFTATAPMEPITGCAGLPFEPSLEARATNPTAGEPTGLKATLVIPQQSPEAVDSPSTATMREARVTLPEGVALAAGAADGIAACTEEQVGYHQEVDAACPDAAKIGVATIDSELLPHPIDAEIFLRNQRPGHIFGLWLVSDQLGLHVKIPGELEPDRQTGQLTAVFADLPRVPISKVELNIWGGPRAPLAVPEACGVYATTYAFTPHSNDPPVTGQSQLSIDGGCGNRGFSPKLHAGTTKPVAGAFSPFVFDLTREESEQNLASFDLNLPDGLLAKLKGVGLCPEAQVGSGSCPADSKIGHLNAAIGPGPSPLWLPQPGKDPTAVYLAGPYKGAPFSVVAVVPAQAGPFDLGNVVVRSALRVDPETAKATVASDPLPRFVEGVAVVYRRVHVVIDRLEFTLNPTDCSELAITSRVTSTRGVVSEPSARFEVDGCKALKFKPSIALKLKEGTERSDYPALSAVVKARKGDANIGKVAVALPGSEFLAQEHIETICTRVQFAAHKCPKGSVYGKAKAWTPLLAKPLEGPVYLRANGGARELPDLVMSLEGEIDIALVGYIDSVKGGGIRTTFATVPDAPVSKFVLKMGGGKKSLLVNSQDVCIGKHRAMVRMTAQNGRIQNSRPALKAAGCRRRG